MFTWMIVFQCTLTIVFGGLGENSHIYKQMYPNARDKHEDNLYIFFYLSLDDILTLFFFFLLLCLLVHSHVRGDFFLFSVNLCTE